MNESNSKEQLLLSSLIEFYKIPRHFIIVTKILKENQFISLRLLDWLVTNYAKKNNIIYMCKNQMTFNIFLEYKNQLKSFSKRYLDPFCRRHRIFYANDHTIIHMNNKSDCDVYKKRKDGFVSTLAQLNFFKWIIQYQVIDYAIANMQIIERDMIASLATCPEKEKEGRKELSVNILKGYTIYKLNVTVSFK